MTKRRSTKRALFSSVVALLLCFAMLLGSTFAWFTDSASSKNNIITAGNLDIEVEYTLDGETWNPLESASDIFQKGLWEPGHTEVVALKIKNNGSLSLKYAANMNILNETVGMTKDGKDIVLSDILTVSTLVQQAVNDDGSANQVGDIMLGLAFKNENNISGNSVTFKAGNVLENDKELHPGAAHYMIVKVDMAETVGNEANHDGVHVPSIEFGINVLATQFAKEYDSFGNQYDKDATYPDLPDTYQVATIDELTAAIASAEYGDIIQLTANINTTQLKVEKGVIIDLGGHELTTNAWGGILLKNGASLVNGTVTHTSAVAAIKAWNAGTIENVTINITTENASNHITGIAVQEGESNGVDVIKDVTITGASQGIEVKYGSYVNLLDNVKITAKTIGKEGTALMVDAGKIGKAVNCEFNGDVYGVHMWLRGEYDVALELEKCAVTGQTALYAHDEAGVSNTTNCSLTLSVDGETTFSGAVTKSFEDECSGVVTITGV